MVPTFQCSPKYRRRISACCAGVIMARLRGHATNPPGRWKEPGAFPATDHTAQRVRQGRGRHPIRRRVRGQCGERHGALGSLIPHAGAVRPLVIAMIKAALRAPPMALARGADRRTACRRATPRRAIGVTAITGRADREETVAAAAHLLAKRRVHDVGAAARFDWTRVANRGTRETTGSVRRSIEAVTEGLEGSAPGPHLIRRSAQLMRRPRGRPNRGGPWTLPELWTHRTRPQLLGKPAHNAGFPRASTAILYFVRKKTNTRRQEPLRRQLSRFTRFQVSGDSLVDAALFEMCERRLALQGRKRLRRTDRCGTQRFLPLLMPEVEDQPVCQRNLWRS